MMALENTQNLLADCSRLIALLREKKATLATVESCTGGLLGSLITSVPGSSSVYQGGWITYSNEAKIRDVGVCAMMLEKEGAVSAQIACAMAEGGQQKTQSDYTLAITGVAGPGGGSSLKPVGLFYLALSRAGEKVLWEKHFQKGSRDFLRHKACQAAVTLCIKILTS